ncbi:MbtH family protein [Rugamonas sp. CCM 8940]|uniref:MbtH family protein n=1 Tax=Rugamonas sp. CCM 8940 TaxID=2765359 RepID=UPI0018F635EA|nr:MbtH family NRPS accessory protein [Rugamonas sp. CCM 8940]MBJ7308875.1 MbtH family NRPS accessory protein [Rugamonas sp. CCM 8940]
MNNDNEQQEYQVLVNHEEQYSLWPATLAIPAGWSGGHCTGSKEQCLAHIDEVWTDMRPLSLRQAMDREASPYAAAP